MKGDTAGRPQHLKGKRMATTDTVITALRSRANLQDPYGERLMKEAARLIEDMAVEIEAAKTATHVVEDLQAEVRRLETLVADQAKSK